MTSDKTMVEEIEEGFWNDCFGVLDLDISRHAVRRAIEYTTKAAATIAQRRVEELADKAAKAMQEARAEIGATEQQRIAFAYAEAAMRAALKASPSQHP